MRISDWSSDVCSSDLEDAEHGAEHEADHHLDGGDAGMEGEPVVLDHVQELAPHPAGRRDDELRDTEPARQPLPRREEDDEQHNAAGHHATKVGLGQNGLHYILPPAAAGLMPGASLTGRTGWCRDP